MARKKETPKPKKEHNAYIEGSGIVVNEQIADTPKKTICLML